MSDTAKRCGRCGELKPVGELDADSATRDGFQASCRTCMRAYQADHDEKNRERHIARVRPDDLRRKSDVAAELKAYLREHPCVGCGTTDARVLEFDHRPGEPTSANVSAVVGMGLRGERILREIAKCDVRCANCHRIITMARGGHFREAWASDAHG